MKISTLSAALVAVVAGLGAGCDSRSPAPAAPTTALVAADVESGCTAQGWASQNGGTDGGGTAAVTVVTTYDQLKAALANSAVKVVQVNGTITIPSGGRLTWQDQSGKTLFGSAGARLVSTDQSKDNSGIIYLKRCSDIVIRNLIFDGPGAYDTDGQDNLTVDACTNLWVDHCEFQDGLDGNLDIKNASNYITVSWTKFTYLQAPRAGGSGGSDDHRFSDLIGSSDSQTGDRGKLNITFARCWWAQGCVERMPRVRFGKVHIANCYYNSTVSNKCIGAGLEANLLIQGNAFEGVNNPIAILDNNETAVQETGNSYTNTTGTKSGDGRTAFTPPYSLSLLGNGSVKSTLTGSYGAGATVGGNTCAHSGI